MVCIEGQAGSVRPTCIAGSVTESTIAALATAPGRSGVGVIRISGPMALSVAVGLCADVPELSPRVATLASWLDEDGEVLDQGLMLYFPAPHSYTGEDVVELQGHGSPVVLRALLSRLFTLGCQPAQPGEFTRRAVSNGKMNLSQAEAVIACIDAATVRAGKQAQKQLQGAFGRRIEALMETITDIVAHVEASLDFAEEDIPELYYETLAQRTRQELVEPIERLLYSASFGERLFDGATVAIIGAPNVGKSSLLNALAGFERAIVSDMPGTTRDVLEIDFEVEGIPVRLADTAGLRDAEDHIEREGIRRAEKTATQADAVIFVADATRPESWRLHQRATIKVMNKIDAVESASWADDFVAISVRTGEGMDRLKKALASQLVDMDISAEDVFVTRERHRLALQEALQYIEAGLGFLAGESELDIAASQWRHAYHALGGILGLGDIEHILDRVFSSFCIGK